MLLSVHLAVCVCVCLCVCLCMYQCVSICVDHLFFCAALHISVDLRLLFAKRTKLKFSIETCPGMDSYSPIATPGPLFPESEPPNFQTVCIICTCVSKEFRATKLTLILVKPFLSGEWHLVNYSLQLNVSSQWPWRYSIPYLPWLGSWNFHGSYLVTWWRCTLR